MPSTPLDRHFAVFLCALPSERPPGLAPEVERPLEAFRGALQGAVIERLGDDSVEVLVDRRQRRAQAAWTRRIDEGLERSALLVGLVQPGIVEARACREELEAFREAEQRADRDDLVVAVLLVEDPVVSKGSYEPLGDYLARRPTFDWRRVAHLPADAPEVRPELHRLADAVVERVRRSVAALPPGPATRKDPGPPPRLLDVSGDPRRVHAARQLQELLADAFSPDDLDRFLRWNFASLGPSLPAPPAPPGEVARVGVELLYHRDLLGPKLFTALRAARPARRDVIDRLEQSLRVR